MYVNLNGYVKPVSPSLGLQVLVKNGGVLPTVKFSLEDFNRAHHKFQEHPFLLDLPTNDNRPRHVDARVILCESGATELSVDMFAARINDLMKSSVQFSRLRVIHAQSTDDNPLDHSVYFEVWLGHLKSALICGDCSDCSGGGGWGTTQLLSVFMLLGTLYNLPIGTVEIPYSSAHAGFERISQQIREDQEV